ncbi:MAG: hydroxyacylglutathione hydrolase [Xanthomonadaceae bacterium]|nr:hydroxyacylglutathione hydrolase [Xanthomonadaceae bacterium]
MRLLPLPAFDDNYIWTWADDDGRALVVDPGDFAPVFAAADAGLRPEVVFITHHHGDHVAGLAALCERWPTLTIYAPEDPRIADPSGSIESGSIESGSIAFHRVGEGDVVDALGHRFDVLSVPGHTRSHIAFVERDAAVPLLFCGDTLFSLGCGRLFEGSAEQMLASLDRLAALPGATRVCCAHEYTLANAKFAAAVDPDNPDLHTRIAQARAQRDADLPTLPITIAEECAANPFLRSDSAAIQASIAARLERSPAEMSRLDTFAELRRWKDGFR